MIQDTKRYIAFICPECRQPVVLERTVFQLAASGSHLHCPCGKSSIDIQLMGDQVRVTVPCLFCKESHTVACSTQAFLTQKTLAFTCANAGIDCLYVGEEDPVFAALQRLEETVDKLEGESAGEGTFLNDLVMEEVLGELRDIGQRGGISCTCGCRDWKLKINYSSVELFCGDCGGALKIPAATLNDLEDLCCKPVLTIRGDKK